MSVPAELEGSDSLLAPDGTPLHLRAWHAPEPRARLLVAHGLGEHGGRYAALARALTARGVSVYAPDLRGHGRSGGARGHADRFGLLVADLEAVRSHLAGTTPALPMLLFGHSLGGLVAARHLTAHPEAAWAGALLSAPALGLPSALPGRDAAARLLSRLAPRLRLPNGVRPEELSHDPEEVRRYREDPLVHRWITPRLYTGMRDAMRAVHDQAGRVRAPLLCLVPTADRVVDPGATLRFADAAGAEVRRLEGWYHEPLHETEREHAIDAVAGWIDRRIG